MAFPEGRDSLDGDVAHAAVSIGWDVADPETAFGQPSPDSVRCEILEALLSSARDGVPRPPSWGAGRARRVVSRDGRIV